MSSNRIEKPGLSVPTVEGFILAGGRSRRMGRDKARIEFEGKTLLARAVATVSAVATKTTVIARTIDAYPESGVPVIADLRPNCGPLAGIETALSAAKSDLVIVLACDMPFVTDELLKFMLERGNPNGAIIPADPDGRPCGVCAVYGREILTKISNLLDAGERRVDALFSNTPTGIVPFTDFSHLSGSPDFLANFNIPDDFTAIRSSRP